MQKAEDNNKRIAKNTAILYIRMFVILIVSLYTSRIILWSLGVSDFGIYSVIGGIVLIFTSLNGSFSGATMRFIAYESEVSDYVKIQRVFAAVLTIHIVIAGVILLLAETIGLWFMSEKLVIPPDRMHVAVYVYHISVITCLTGIIQIPYSATIIANEKMHTLAFISIYEAVIKLLIAYLMSMNPFDCLVFYSTSLFIAQLSVTFIYCIYCRMKFGYCRFHISKDFGIIKPILSFSMWDIFGTVSTTASSQGISFALNMFYGSTINAAAGIANQINIHISGFANNFLYAVKPQVVKYYARENISEMQRLATNAGKFAYFLLFLFGFPLIVECDYVVRIWLIDVPEYLVAFSQLSIIYNLIAVMYRPCIQCIHAVGKVRLMSFVTGALFYLTIPLAYIILKYGGTPKSPYMMNLIFISVISLTYLIILHHYVHDFSIRHYFLHVTGICILVSLLSMPLPIVIHYSLPQGVLRLCLVSISSVVSLLLCIYYFALPKSIKNEAIHKIRCVFCKIIS